MLGLFFLALFCECARARQEAKRKTGYARQTKNSIPECCHGVAGGVEEESVKGVIGVVEWDEQEG